MITSGTKICLLLAGAALALSGCGNSAEAGDSTNPAASPPVSVASPTQSVSPEVTASPALQATPASRPAPVRPAAPVPRPPAPAPAPVVAAPPSQPDYPTAGISCEDGLEHVDELGALGADCETARRVAAAVDTKILLLGEVPLEPFNAVDGWVCAKDPRQFDEYVHISCDKGNSRMESVTFGWGT